VRLARRIAGAEHASIWAERDGVGEVQASEGASLSDVVARLEVALEPGTRLVVGACTPRAWSDEERAGLEELADLAVEAHAVLAPSFSPAALYRAAAGHLPNAAVLMFDRDLRYVLAEGPLLLATAGLAREELIGRRVGSSAPDPSAIEALCARALAGETSSLRMRRGERVFAITTSPVRDRAGLVTHGLLFAFDETERLDAERTIRERSLRDPLTGLYNRAGFFDAVRAALADEGRAGLLVFADLDGLKEINDTEGHAAGDRAIAAAADALRAALREHDVIGRLGGDELAAFVVGAVRDDAAIDARIRAACASVSERGVTVSLSVGMAPCAHGDDVLERLAAADRAMYADKRRRRGRVSNVP
jgi:diguanylate cyclase (GGDEF)-like protein